MLTRLYVDNFRALVNTDLQLGRRTLLMGSNGTGKSTLGDVLIRLQWALFGQSKTDEIFSVDTLTRWQSVPRQRFEIDATGPDGDYHYELVVEHRKTASADVPRTRIPREALTINSQPLFHFEDGLVRLYRDDHSVGPEYPFDWGRSALGTISARPDNQKLTWFLRWLQGLTVLRPNPPQMEDLIERDDFLLFLDAKNFAAWYHTASSGDKLRDRLLHDALAEDGLPAWAKTSGSKGMQLYVPVTVDAVPDTSEYAKQLCLRLARSHPDLVVGTMAKQARPGRVYIDWSQNHQAKTTIAAYSLRARQEPTVSTPLTWAEVRACQRVDELVFTASDVRKRLDTHGDLLADLDATRYPLPQRD